MQRATSGLAVALALLSLPTPVAQAADAPPWLREAAARVVAAASTDGAIVLVDALDVVVDGEGRVTTTRRYAARVLSSDGEQAAAVQEVVTTDSGRVRVMRGWTLSGGRVTELGRGQIATVALTENDIYNEARLHVLRAPAGLPPDTVFGAETTVTERSVFTQIEWVLQRQWPATGIRRSLTVPDGVSVTSLTFNHATIAPRRDGATYRWDVPDLPAIADEPWSPSAASLAPRLAVTYAAPAGALGPSFASWDAVAGWLATLGDPAAAAAPVLSERARQLTAGSTTERDRLAAIGTYVQRVQYVSIQTGVGRGGGYRPHPAADVLARNYGDCKDKVALLRALLTGVGIRSRLVAVYAGDPGRVRDAWPSPQQFNHVIAAIAVSSAIEGGAVGTDAELGRVLYFDPTDEFTPLGELPLALQGTWGLPGVAAGSALVRLPVSAPDQHRIERRTTATLSPTGALHAEVVETFVGDAAATARAVRQTLSADDYAAMLVAQVARGLAGARVTPGAIADTPRDNRFERTLTLDADRVVQPAGGSLLLVRVPAAWFDPVPSLGSNRRNPVALASVARRDHLRLTIPTGTAIDTLPASVTATRPFGAWTVQWRSDGVTLIRDVTLTVAASTVPATEAQEVEAFFVGLRRALEPPVVLRLAAPR